MHGNDSKSDASVWVLVSAHPTSYTTPSTTSTSLPPLTAPSPSSPSNPFQINHTDSEFVEERPSAPDGSGIIDSRQVDSSLMTLLMEDGGGSPEGAVAWLQSPAGQALLMDEGSGPTSAIRRLHKQGQLQEILHRPDWPLVSLSYVPSSDI